MSAILKFIRENHILALIEQAIVKRKSKLNLNAYEMTEIPLLLFSCAEIEELYLHRNKINSFPVQLTELQNLTSLTLDYNNITALPHEIGNLKSLVNLNVSYNPIKVLVPEIGDLENLEAFWCNKCGLTEIPKEIGKLSKLDTFGARGNELTTIPREMTQLDKLRWLTLESNHISSLPDCMDCMAGLVHCNFRNNRLTVFPMSLLKCQDLMFLQVNNNQISSLPDDFDCSQMVRLEMIDLRLNPICELVRVDHPLLRYTDSQVDDGSELPSERPQLAVNGTALRQHAPRPAVHPVVVELDVDSSSIESSEDWENSVNSSELDAQYQTDEERIDNEAVGMVLPELSRFASTAS